MFMPSFHLFFPKTTKSRHCYYPAFQRWQVSTQEYTVSVMSRVRMYSSHYPSIQYKHWVWWMQKSVLALISVLFHKYPGKVSIQPTSHWTCRKPFVLLSPLPNFVRIGKNGPNSNQYSPSFLQFLNIIREHLATPLQLIPMTEVIMRTRLMFKHNPFSCNKMMQSFLYLHRARNMGKQFEIKANFFQQCWQRLTLPRG